MGTIAELQAWHLNFIILRFLAITKILSNNYFFTDKKILGPQIQPYSMVIIQRR